MKILLSVRSVLILGLLIFCGVAFAQETPPTRLLISQVSSEYSYAFTYQYVELYNPTSSTISLSGTSLQYESTSDGTWLEDALTTPVCNSLSVLPGHYFLIQLYGAANNEGTSLNPTPDCNFTTVYATNAATGVQTYVLQPSETTGTVALVNGTAVLASGCPASSTYNTSGGFLDIVGYGTSACQEAGFSGANNASGTVNTGIIASGGVSAITTTTAAVRKSLTSDYGENSSDFGLTAPQPHNAGFGYAWLVSSTGTTNKYTGSGNAPANSSGTNGISYLFGPQGAGVTATTPGLGGVAMDSNGTAWSVTSTNNVLNSASASSSGTAGQYSGGGLSTPTAVAVDGQSFIWVANGTSSGSISKFTNIGAAVSPSTGYTSGSGGVFSQPGGIAIDTSGNVWVTNTGNSSLIEVLGAAAPVSPISTAVLTGTTGARP